MTIGRYNPLEAPDAEQWLALDDGEKTQLVLEYHTRARVEVPNANMHATLHVIVENQIALGDETLVQLKARQLMAESPDRHQAIHAIASMLIGHLTEAMKIPGPAADANQRYYAALGRLNAQKWSRSG